MAIPTTHRVVRILDVDPDLGADLDSSAFAQAHESIVCPHVAIPAGEWQPADLAAHPSVRGRLFGCLITEGLIVREVLLAGRLCTQLFGPGDLITTDELTEASLPVAVRHEAPTGVGLALLDDRFLAASRRWPRITARLMDVATGQLKRTSVHQAISQLPRVEDRLLALFWHLADRWAQVGSDGIVVRLPLTHEALGRLIGARRPTVSLGLRMLAEQGVLIRRDDGGWLLAAESLQALETGDVPRRRSVVVPKAPRRQEIVPVLHAASAIDRDALFERVTALRQQVAADRERVRASIARNQQVRAQLLELRAAREAARRRADMREVAAA